MNRDITYKIFTVDMAHLPPLPKIHWMWSNVAALRKSLNDESRLRAEGVALSLMKNDDDYQSLEPHEQSRISTRIRQTNLVADRHQSNITALTDQLRRICPSIDTRIRVSSGRSRIISAP